MHLGKTLLVKERGAWRKWLKGHYKTDAEIWLIYFKKRSGKERISYNDAVEEALCFGWIDSTVKSIDAERFAQRFSPRKPKSKISPANKERLRKLIKEGKVAKDILATLSSLSKETFVIRKDILEAIQANKKAWKNFQNFSAAYKRIRIGFIEGARNRPTEFKKRLGYFVKMSEKGKMYGFGGIEKHY